MCTYLVARGEGVLFCLTKVGMDIERVSHFFKRTESKDFNCIADIYISSFIKWGYNVSFEFLVFPGSLYCFFIFQFSYIDLFLCTYCLFVMVVVDLLQSLAFIFFWEETTKLVKLFNMRMQLSISILEINSILHHLYIQSLENLCEIWEFYVVYIFCCC